jgi:hypothetical protein
MIKRAIIFMCLLSCLSFIVARHCQSATYEDFKRQLREILVPRGDEFTDDELTYLVVMGRIAVHAHGLCESHCYSTEVGDTILCLYPGQQHLKMPTRDGTNSLDTYFPTAISRITGGQFIPIAQAVLEDPGHLPTQAPLSYFAFYRDGMTTFVYLWPPQPAKYETLQICYYKCGFSAAQINEDNSYFSAWLSYSLFLAYIAMENYVEAANSYNDYRREIARLREEIINEQPDITVAPKIIR